MLASFSFTQEPLTVKFEVHKELLKLVSLHDTTKGKDVFNAIKSVVSIGPLTSSQQLLPIAHHQCKEDAPGTSNRAALTVQYCTASYIRWIMLSLANY